MLEAWIEIKTTHSGDPRLEPRIITQVASYGRQLGWLAERVAAVMEQAALDQVNRIVAEVAPIL